ASPKGEFLAVAGNDDHSILLFRTADLLQKQVIPHQVLRSLGATIRSAAFIVHRQGKLGILLSEKTEARNAGAGAPKQPQYGDLVIDPMKRILIPWKANEWTLSGPASGGWGVEVIQPGRDATGSVSEMSLFKIKERSVQKGAVSLGSTKHVDQ